MKLFERTGTMALGSRLRLFSSRITDEAAKIYESYQVDFAPKWFPAFFVLAEDGDRSITEIANEIGHSQPSVSKIVREMIAAGLVKEKQKTGDKRTNKVALTRKGREISAKLKIQFSDVEAAVNTMISEARFNLWEALQEWEYLLDQKSLFKRVQEQAKLRESKDIRIVEYNESYQNAFRSLNEEWISRYFKMEEADKKALYNPREYILDKGGSILVAVYQGEPVGVCALLKMDDPDYDFELAKMAVSPSLRGRNIGWLLGNAVIQAAKETGAKKLYLESNTLLKPAISLYHKLGFKKVVGRPSPYERCNIQMELSIEQSEYQSG